MNAKKTVSYVAAQDTVFLLFHRGGGSEILYTVESGVVCIVEIVSAVHGGAAKEQYIVALEEEVDVLHTFFVPLSAFAEIVEVAD